MEKNIIETIPSTMEIFFGCSGEMVKPSTDTVATTVEKIPKGQLVTLEQIRGKIASDFNVETTCPASTMKALHTLSKFEKPICYWRVIKKKGELIAKFPNGTAGHAVMLENEGFEIDYSRKNQAVVDYENKLTTFA